MLALLVLSATFAVQEPVAGADSGFFRRGDGKLAAAVVAGTVGLSFHDEKIARWTRRPNVQGDSSRRDLVDLLTQVNEKPLTIAAVATYGVGRLARSRMVADVGLHLTESLVATEVVAEAIRVGLGRERPRASPEDAFAFTPGRGLTHFEHRSFPSLHAAVAFATAASLVEEIRVRKPSAVRYSAPLLYGAAMIPGFTRLYLDQHWASDVLAGSFLGWLLATRIVRHAHCRPTRLDRIFLMRAMPGSEGMIVGWTSGS